MSDLNVTTITGIIQSPLGGEVVQVSPEIEYIDLCFVCGDEATHKVATPDGEQLDLCEVCFYLFGWGEDEQSKPF